MEQNIYNVIADAIAHAEGGKFTLSKEQFSYPEWQIYIASMKVWEELRERQELPQNSYFVEGDKVRSSCQGEGIIASLSAIEAGTTAWFELFSQYVALLSQVHSTRGAIGDFRADTFLVQDGQVVLAPALIVPRSLQSSDVKAATERAFSPEQFYGTGADAVSDVYCLGVMALSALGRVQPGVLSCDLLRGKGIPLNIFSLMSPVEKEFFLALTAQRRGDRFQSCEEVAAYLFRHGIITEQTFQNVKAVPLQAPFPALPIFDADILDKIDDYIFGESVHPVLEVAGEEGYGKTAFLNYIKAEVVLAGKNVVKYREMSDFSRGRADIFLVFTDDTKKKSEAFNAKLKEFAQSLTPQQRLVAAHRTQIPQLGSRLHLIPMRALSNEQVREYCEEAMGAGALPDDLYKNIYQVSKGNPLYLRLLLIYWSRSGMLKRVRGRWQVAAEAEYLPENIQVLVRELSATFGQELLKVAHIISGIFEDSTLEQVSEITGEAMSALLPSLDMLLGYSLAKVERGFMRAGYSFVLRSLLSQEQDNIFEQLRRAAEHAHAEEDWHKEEQLLNKMEAYATTEQRSDLLAATELQRASSSVRREEYREALAAARRSKSLFQKTGDLSGALFADFVVMKSLFELREFELLLEQAPALVEECLAAEFIEDAVALLFFVGEAEEQHHKNYQRAVAAYRRIMELAEQVQARRTYARASLCEARSLVALQRYAPADNALLAAAAIFDEKEDVRSYLETMCQRLELYVLTNDKATASDIAAAIGEKAQSDDHADIIERKDELLATLALKPDPMRAAQEELPAEGEPLMLFRSKHQDPRFTAGFLAGNSPSVKKLREDIKLATTHFIPVLLSASCGDKPDIYARLIHGICPFTKGKFSMIECEEYSAAELDLIVFGNNEQSPEGEVWRCCNGTLYLHNLHEADIAFQQKILRLIEKQQARKIGSLEWESTSLRVIASVDKAGEAQLMPELYFKLLAGKIIVPTLQERRSDIPALAEYVVQKLAEQNALPETPTIPRRLLERLMQRRWSGNIAELESLLQRLLLSASDGVLPTTLPPEDKSIFVSEAATPTLTGELDTCTDIDEMQKNHILAVLQSVNGNKSAAARLMNIKRTTLIARMKKYNIMP